MVGPPRYAIRLRSGAQSQTNGGYFVTIQYW
jgi:hypothetical protein